MYIKILLLVLALGLFTSCQKNTSNNGIDLSKVRIAYVFVKQKPDRIKITFDPVTGLPNITNSRLYVTLDEGPVAYKESQIFQELINNEGYPFFEKLVSYNEYAYLERDRTYSMALFHDFTDSNRRPRSRIVNNIVFKPSDYLPNPNNQFSLKNGELELVVSIYE
ncbi:MAG: hypothetical protein ACRBFS_12000 [Aureispira sp.]